MVFNRLTLHSPVAAGSEIARFVRCLAARTGLSAGQEYRLRLAADEIVTNVVSHGQVGPCGLLEIVGGEDRDTVWMRIVDEAAAFDPTSHDPRPRLAANPASGPEGGLGLFLALNAVDDFHYDRRDGQNRNTLIMRRS